jgi:DNA-binding MarR family transcriptional regulator
MVNEPRPPRHVLAPGRHEALVFLLAHPDASNREIAAGVGIAEESQASRLLTRMEDLGLIRNRNPYDNGAPDAWQLTGDGRRLLQALEDIGGAA